MRDTTVSIPHPVRPLQRPGLGVVMTLLLGLLGGLFPPGAVAQSNAFLDRILAAPTVRADEAAYLVLAASDNIGDDADPTRAFELLGSLGWVPSGVRAETPVDYQTYSFLVAKAFGVEGGWLFGWFPTPRYAYRALVAQVVVQGATDPQMRVTGSAAVRILGRVFDVKGVQE